MARRSTTSSDDTAGVSASAKAISGTRLRLIGVLSFAVVLVVAVIVGGVIWSHSQPGGDTGPLAVGAVPSPGASGKQCTQLMTALPQQLAGSDKRPVIDDPAGVAAWGDPPITLRCGLPTPQELTCSSQLIEVANANGQTGVLWLQLTEGGQTTYIAADRPVRIALTLPDKSGTSAIQQISAVVSGVMPSTADSRGRICTNGKLHPTSDQ